MSLDTEEGQELAAKQNKLVDTHTGILQYDPDKKYSYIRWQNIVNIVMGKDVGNSKIHRTRILSIYNAEYSVLIDLMWKDLLSSSGKRSTLNRGLHGGRCGHEAQTLSLIEELKYNICYCSRKSLVNFDNGTEKGSHKNVTIAYAQMLEQAKYRLETALGVSEEYYQHFTTFLICSSGQKATNSLSIWLTISSTIGDIYEQSANGTEFISPDKAISLVLAILGFVDNITNQDNVFTDNQMQLQQPNLSL
eukprot:3577486-Ditylum_brightwellii.AAC.1